MRHRSTRERESCRHDWKPVRPAVESVLHRNHPGRFLPERGCEVQKKWGDPSPISDGDHVVIREGDQREGHGMRSDANATSRVPQGEPRRHGPRHLTGAGRDRRRRAASTSTGHDRVPLRSRSREDRPFSVLTGSGALAVPKDLEIRRSPALVGGTELNSPGSVGLAVEQAAKVLHGESSPRSGYLVSGGSVRGEPRPV
jgi:hypothetical protein